MKAWAETRPGRERQDVLAWAEKSGNLKEAARILRMSRRHLTRLIGETRRTRETAGLSETQGPGETPSRVGALAAGETPTFAESLTYRDARPKLGGMGSAMMGRSIEESGEPLNLPNVPKSTKEWLETEALRRKQAGLTRRPNMTLVLVDAVKALQAQQAQDDGGEKPKAARRERGEGEGEGK